MQASLTFLPKTPEPFVGRSYAYACSLCGIFDTQTLLDTLDKKGSTARCKTGMFMQVHPGLLEGMVGRTSRIPGMPRMNNLLRDH
ncbi:hypothetical protein NA644_22920, partial [Pseudomonas stutzeri]|uniref:hypothetical protein n=1 Tax=Stutzerimonas stutzeri TaxID=316 RepID=UPI001EE6E504